MWSVKTGQRERERERERRVKGRQKITDRNKTICSRYHGTLSGFLLIVAVYGNLAGM